MKEEDRWVSSPFRIQVEDLDDPLRNGRAGHPSAADPLAPEEASRRPPEEEPNCRPEARTEEGFPGDPSNVLAGEDVEAFRRTGELRVEEASLTKGAPSCRACPEVADDSAEETQRQEDATRTLDREEEAAASQLKEGAAAIDGHTRHREADSLGSRRGPTARGDCA